MHQTVKLTCNVRKLPSLSLIQSCVTESTLVRSDGPTGTIERLDRCTGHEILSFPAYLLSPVQGRPLNIVPKTHTGSTLRQTLRSEFFENEASRHNAGHRVSVSGSTLENRSCFGPNVRYTIHTAVGEMSARRCSQERLTQ